MSRAAFLSDLAGAWAGTKRLWLTPEEPVRQSLSTAILAPAAQGRFASLAYTWEDDGAPQDGLLLIGMRRAGEAVDALWIDSWHMGDRWMLCRGAVTPEGVLQVQGSYAAPTGPDWGWRIALERRDDGTLCLAMDNVPPDDTPPQRAVDIVYERRSAHA